MRKQVRGYFQHLYEEEVNRRPMLDSLQFKELGMVSRTELERNFIEEEIFNGIKECNSNKAPKPDGSNMQFLQEFWHVIKWDLLAVFKGLYVSGSFVKSLNSISLALLVKADGAKNIKTSILART